MWSRLLRIAYAKEALPARVRWWMAAAGMIDFARILARDLPLENSKTVVAAMVARMFERRWAVLKKPSWPEDQAAMLAALYRLPEKHGWITGGVVRRSKLIGELHAEERWSEVTVHLGELLIVATEDLPSQLKSTRKTLGDICFKMGVRYAERALKAFSIARSDNAPAQAIEILRMSEYIFRVNPEHWSEIDVPNHRGSLEGTACPWYMRPGWDAGHCGIFGQFQAGICSVFGLKYRLAETIPKHGGTTCKVELVPLPKSKMITAR